MICRFLWALNYLADYCSVLARRGSRARVYELLDLIEDPKQPLHRKGILLRVASADADHPGSGGMQGKLYPTDPISGTSRCGQAANHHVRVEASHLFFEHVQRRGGDFSAGATHSDAGRDHLPVDAIIVLQSHQHSYLDCPPLTTTFDKANDSSA
jgi:hypothetical protein